MNGLYVNIRKTIAGCAGKSFTVKTEMHVACAGCAALFGHSGSGKTTLLRLIAGLDKPDEGVISFNNTVWFDSQKGISVVPQKRRVGFVFQEYALFPAMSVVKNIAYGLPRNSTHDIEFYLDIFDLQKLRNRLPQTLSGGQKQRVALARACAQNPPVLLLDEPLAALDMQARDRLQDAIVRIREKTGITTVLVSHDIAEIFRLAGSVYKIESGSVVSSGTPQTVFQSPSDRLNITGRLLEKKMHGVICIVTVAIGSGISHLAISAKEAAALSPGDMLCISVKAFNPHIRVLSCS